MNSTLLYSTKLYYTLLYKIELNSIILYYAKLYYTLLDIIIKYSKVNIVLNETLETVHLRWQHGVTRVTVEDKQP